ncbi:MAG: hypothetical protein IH624_16025 [Phycisphaerae bacterium]|nr:hypothetical protein [Phycisphaerae bacterium]
MRKQTCDLCGHSFGLNELLSAFNETLCGKCADGRLENVDSATITDKTVFRLTDPTICARCTADNGDVPFESTLEMPLCDRCSEQIRHYPFPLWIKAACVGLVIVVVWTLAANARFFKARILMDRSLKLAFQQGEIPLAAEQMYTAANLVPESQELATLSSFLSGVVAMQQEKWGDAVRCFEQCRDLPPQFQLDMMMSRAQIAVAFDNKDYGEFLRLSLDLLAQLPGNPTAIAQAGSAHACMYAAEGRPEDRQKALDFLARAEEINRQDPDPTFDEYRERIIHRIETRQIITAEAYRKLHGIAQTEKNP